MVVNTRRTKMDTIICCYCGKEFNTNSNENAGNPLRWRGMPWPGSRRYIEPSLPAARGVNFQTPQSSWWEKASRLSNKRPQHLRNTTHLKMLVRLMLQRCNSSHPPQKCWREPASRFLLSPTTWNSSYTNFSFTNNLLHHTITCEYLPTPP